MTAIFVKDGRTVEFTTSAAMNAGDVHTIGDNIIGVLKQDYASGVKATLHVTGTYDFPKATGGGSAMTAGKLAYWDEDSSASEPAAVATETSTGNTLLGKVVQAATDDDETVRIMLTPSASG